MKTETVSSASGDDATLEQIRKDLPRTIIHGPKAQAAPLQALVEDPRLRGLMERVLFLRGL